MISVTIPKWVKSRYDAYFKHWKSMQKEKDRFFLAKTNAPKPCTMRQCKCVAMYRNKDEEWGLFYVYPDVEIQYEMIFD